MYQVIVCHLGGGYDVKSEEKVILDSEKMKMRRREGGGKEEGRRREGGGKEGRRRDGITCRFCRIQHTHQVSTPVSSCTSLCIPVHPDLVQRNLCSDPLPIS